MNPEIAAELKVTENLGIEVQRTKINGGPVWIKRNAELSESTNQLTLPSSQLVKDIVKKQYRPHSDKNLAAIVINDETILNDPMISQAHHALVQILRLAFITNHELDKERAHQTVFNMGQVIGAMELGLYSENVKNFIKSNGL